MNKVYGKTEDPLYVVLFRAFNILAIIVGLPALFIWWEWYKFQDCKAVGHATLYCLGKMIF